MDGQEERTMAQASRRWVRWGLGWGAMAVVLAGALVGLLSSPDRPGGRTGTGGSAVRPTSGPARSEGSPRHAVAGAVTGKTAISPAPVPGGGEMEPAPDLTGVAGPRVVKSATLSVEVGRGAFEDRFQRAAAIAGAAGGFVAS